MGSPPAMFLDETAWSGELATKPKETSHARTVSLHWIGYPQAQYCFLLKATRWKGRRQGHVQSKSRRHSAMGRNAANAVDWWYGGHAVYWLCLRHVSPLCHGVARWAPAAPQGGFHCQAQERQGYFYELLDNLEETPDSVRELLRTTRCGLDTKIVTPTTKVHFA